MRPPGVTEVNIFAIMGGAQIIVPPGVHVDMSGFALMGGFGQSGYAPPPTDPNATVLRIGGFALMGGFGQTGSAPLPTDPNAPVLRIGGFALMGGVEVNIRYPGERPRDARDREKLERKERKRLSGG